jgi:hypothetical protein
MIATLVTSQNSFKKTLVKSLLFSRRKLNNIMCPPNTLRKYIKIAKTLNKK